MDNKWIKDIKTNYMKFKSFIGFLKGCIDKFKKVKASKENHFNPLTPTDNAEECEIYFESIQWALDNRKTIRNIAISGAYGSGKSSILKTFIKRITDSEKLFKKLFCPKFRFLNISLATFKDTSSNSANGCEINSNSDLLRLIELSIVQQLFFHEKNHKTPDSRFKKIKKEGWLKLFMYSLLAVMSILSIIYLFFPDIFRSIKLLNFIKEDSLIAGYITSIVVIFSLFLLILKSSRSLISASIKKLNINNAEIEIDNGISKSILNNHLDEIIYFFEATKYNIVIIEDLDRFEQTEVFTKLREINALINNSNKIKRNIVFIYAIKDDMFLDKDRAKFFDFIIPIIPVIDYSNSGNKLRKIISQNKYNISENLIDDLSMFIDDLRLLYNIMNEYYIYSKKLGSNFQNQILGMIVYKNIFPNDFTLLSQNDGDLYKTIERKQEYIKSALLEIDENVQKIKIQIQAIEEQRLLDLNELRSIYLIAIIESIGNYFIGFNDNQSLTPISGYCSDANFKNVINGSFSYFYFGTGYGNQQRGNHNFKFQEIENKVNPSVSYKQREYLILSKSKVADLKKEIEKLLDSKKEIQKSKLQDLLTLKKISVVVNTDGCISESEKKKDLINILLRNGYIDENYSDYISIFHEGALTKSDYQFLINVKKEESTDLNYRIFKTTELIKKIDEYAFEKEYVFNYMLIDSLVKSPTFKNKKKIFLSQICNESKSSLGFIDQYIDNTKIIELFVREVCHNWHNIWNFLLTKTHYTDERLDSYFRLLIEYADIEDVRQIFNNHVQYINNYKDFLNISASKGQLIGVIDALDLKFQSIESDSPKDLLDYIFKGNHYDINIEMFQILMSHNSDFVWEDFEKANYSYILLNANQYQIDYIDSNINKYIESVYLKLENNSEEELDYYIQLLNIQDLDFTLKESVIIKEKTIIQDVSLISDSTVINSLFKFSKVSATWNNVLYGFNLQEDKISMSLLEFLNELSNATILSNETMTKDDVSKFSTLCEAIIHEPKIQTDSYKLLTKSIPLWYEEFDVSRITKDMINILIENECVNPTLTSYLYLKTNFIGTNIFLLEKYFDELRSEIKDVAISSLELTLILDSDLIVTSSKFDLIQNVDEELLSINPENAKKMAQLLIDNSSYLLPANLKLLLIGNVNIPPRNRLILFDRYINLIKKDMIDDFLTSLKGDYEEITNNSKKATLENNSLNRKLLDHLVMLDYISSVSVKEKGLRVNHKR